MQISKTDSMSTSTITPKIFLANDHDDNITEIPIEFFKSKPKRLTSTDILHYLTQNFSKEKESMLKLFNLEDLKQTKDVVLISLIISSLSNIIKPETNQDPNPSSPAFEIVKITKIQSNNQFEDNSFTAPENFSGTTDTDFEINVDEFGNIWIRNIFIDSEKNAIASNWYVYSITGKHLAEFDNSGFKAEAYRFNLLEYAPGAKSIFHFIGDVARINELKEQLENLNKKLDEKESENKDLRKEYEAKLEKKNKEFEAKLEKKDEYWAKQISEKHQEIKDLNNKFFDFLSKDKQK